MMQLSSIIAPIIFLGLIVLCGWISMLRRDRTGLKKELASVRPQADCWASLFEGHRLLMRLQGGKDFLETIQRGGKYAEIANVILKGNRVRGRYFILVHLSKGKECLPFKADNPYCEYYHDDKTFFGWQPTAVTFKLRRGINTDTLAIQFFADDDNQFFDMLRQLGEKEMRYVALDAKGGLHRLRTDEPIYVPVEFTRPNGYWTDLEHKLNELPGVTQKL